MATTASSTGTSTTLDERELRAWRGLLRVHAALTKALDAELESEHRLPLSSYEVLLHLAFTDGERLRMSDLADAVVLSRSGLTRLVDRLERDGLIARESCPSDARGSYARLLPPAARSSRGAAHPPGGRPRALPGSSEPGGAGAHRRDLGSRDRGRGRRARTALQQLTLERP